MSIESKGASYYVDGRNLASYGQRFSPDNEVRVDPGRIVKEISESARGLSMDSVSYFTGLPPANISAWRAREVYKLDKLADRGVQTFANDLEFKDGKYHEVGVDLRMGAAMIEDFLTHGVRKFVILSNDRDFEPIVEKLLDLSKKTQQPIKIYNAVHGNARPLEGTQRLEIDDRAVQKSLFDWKPFMKDALENHDRDKDRALDASRHEKPAAAPAKRAPGALDGVAVMVDLQSLAATTRGPALDRPYLDCAVPELVDATSAANGWTIAAKTAYSCIHDKAVNLKQSVFTAQLLTRMSERDFAAKQFTYQYSRQTASGENGETTGKPTMLPREKKIHATILVDAVALALQKSVKTIVIMSDDRNLGPIVPLVKRVARLRGEDSLNVIHLKLDARTKTYAGAEEVVLSREEYLAHLDPVDRLQEAEVGRREVLYNDLGAIDQQLKAAIGSDPAFVVRPEQTEGKHLLRSDYWTAFRQTDGSIAVYDNDTLPVTPLVNQNYRISEKGRAIEIAPVKFIDSRPFRNGGVGR